ncbi:hypothetical protein HYDPIDRAFT_77322 [Hydnomerulius pinastri MD-312]|nr:hypothetical protein HYDPIDRAFT_77322 [Hydnomerulius pinastri MD-312]
MNILRHFATATRRPLRPASASFVALRCRRNFSFTPCVQASEQDDAFLNNFKNTSIFRKIADKPEALMALRDFATLMKEKGIDASSGPPSTTQMIRLAASSDFRAAAQRVVEELKNAGVDLTSQDAMQELMALSKKSGGT